MSTQYRLFLGVTPRLERLLDAELTRLGFDQLERARGGVKLRTDAEGLWTLAHRSRLAESVNVEIGRFKAHSFDELLAGIEKLPWHIYVPDPAAVEVHATTSRSTLYHTKGIEGRVREAIQKRLGDRVRVQGEASRLHVRVVRDRVEVTADAIGSPMHRRGYRTHVGVAPIRETLAAACVDAAELDLTQPIWDPFCGSGTMVFEHAIATRGYDRARPLACRQWAGHDDAAYLAWAGGLVHDTDEVARYGSDLNGDEVRAAKSNGARVGVEVDWRVGDFAEIAASIPAGTAILTNLPYGVRAGEPVALRHTYERLGRLLRERRDLGPVVVLVGHQGFIKATGLRWERLLEFRNRGLKVELLRLSMK